MLTIPSWTGPPPIARGLVRRIRRFGRRTPLADASIDRVQVLVFPSSSSPQPATPSVATLGSIDRARETLVSVEVTTHRPPLDSLGFGTGVLSLFVVDGAELEPHALARIVEVFDADASLDMVYCDAAPRLNDASLVGELDLDVDGPWLLPGFSPDRLADQFYLGHVVACRASTSLSGAGGRQKHAGEIDGPWSMAAIAEAVVHVPEPLYRPSPGVGLWKPNRVERRTWRPPCDEGAVNLPLVSVVIPTNGSIRNLERGPTRLVDQAVRSVLTSRYPRIEIVVVLTPGSPDEVGPMLRDLLERYPGSGRTLTVVTDHRPFNFSNACNRGAIAATGDVLVFLNDDTEVIEPDWLAYLVDHASKPDVGPVGARLLYEDGRVQHSGIWSRGGHPTHRYEGWPGDADGYLGALRVTQNCLAVTGACLAVERAKFELVGGFSPVFPNSYNDVDLCLKLWDRGYRTVVEPRAELYHFEASTRDPSITDDDLAALHARWRWRLNHDPFDNPNHTAERSEEWPLPAGERRLLAEDLPTARRWPLDPVGRLSSS